MRSALIFSWLTFAARGIGIVALAPAIFRYYDIEEAHAWFEILAFYQLFLLLDLGFLPVLSKYYAYISASVGGVSSDQQPAQIVEIDCFIVSIYRVVSVLAFAIAFFCVMNFSTYFRGDYIFSLFFSLSTAFYIYGGRYRAKIEGLQFIDKSKKIELIYSLVQLCSCLFLLLAGVSFIYVIVSYYATSFLYIWLLRWNLNKTFGVNKKEARLHSGEKIRIARDAVKNGVSIISSVGLTQALTLIVSKKSSLEDASAILFSLILLRQIINFSQMPFYVSLPLLAKQFAEKKVSFMKKTAWRGYLSFLLVYLLSSMAILILEPSIVKILNKSVIYPDALFWIFIVVAFLVERTFSMYQQYLAACDRIYWHITNPSSAVILITSFSLLLPYCKYNALPISVVLSYSMALFFVVLFERRLKSGQ